MVYDARGLRIRVALDPETIVDSLEPLNVDGSTHLWRTRLHKVLEMCFLTQTVKRTLSNHEMPSNYPIRPLDMLIIIFCASCAQTRAGAIALLVIVGHYSHLPPHLPPHDITKITCAGTAPPIPQRLLQYFCARETLPLETSGGKSPLRST